MKSPETAQRRNKHNWRRPVAAIGGAALGVSVLAGCNFSFLARDTSHAAENPTVDRDLLNQLRGLGTQAAKDYVTNGSHLELGLKAINVGHTLYINYLAPDGYRYSEDVVHTADEEEIQDGRITEEEMSQITCTVEAPEALGNLEEGKTVLTKQPDGTWYEHVLINNLTGKPSVCGVVESYLEPAQEESGN